MEEIHICDFFVKWYCWWNKSQTTTWDVMNSPVNNGKSYQPLFHLPSIAAAHLWFGTRNGSRKFSKAQLWGPLKRRITEIDNWLVVSTIFMFIPIWGRFPLWLIFFRWVETTNQTNVVWASCWLWSFRIFFGCFPTPLKNPATLQLFLGKIPKIPTSSHHGFLTCWPKGLLDVLPSPPISVSQSGTPKTPKQKLLSLKLI